MSPPECVTRGALLVPPLTTVSKNRKIKKKCTYEFHKSSIELFSEIFGQNFTVRNFLEKLHLCSQY